MRVILDVNIFISYLLNPQRPSPAHTIMQAAILGQFTLLLPQAVTEEFTTTVQAKKRLNTKITIEQVEQFITDLATIAEVTPVITEPIPAVIRDPKDDYLLAYALVSQADYLVTGDQDLLVLHTVEETEIVTPRQFAEILSP